MMEGIAFYVPHKSRVLIIPCKADDYCLFIELPDKRVDSHNSLLRQFSVKIEVTLLMPSREKNSAGLVEIQPAQPNG